MYVLRAACCQQIHRSQTRRWVLSVVCVHFTWVEHQFSKQLRAQPWGLFFRQAENLTAVLNFYEPLLSEPFNLVFFTSSGDSIREPGTFPGTLKISESREGDYKVSAAEVKWPPTNDLIYKFWNSAKGPFLSPPKACIKKLCGPDLIKLFTALIYSTLNIKHIGWLFQAEDFFPLLIPKQCSYFCTTDGAARIFAYHFKPQSEQRDCLWA